MDMSAIGSLIGTLGFPIVVSLILFFGCKYMLDQQQKNTDRMFEMYEKSNTDNRNAVIACTDAINKLTDKLSDITKE
ncbi:MAG: hypothetical protein J6S67_21450 [Methanobrevibacter sp.]|nr:hypothetical protein [Methanobrevibacter sp.]